MSTDTPRTNHLWDRLSLMKWGRTDMPVSLIMESHEQLERELAAERALADRMAFTFADVTKDFAKAGDLAKVDRAYAALAAWKDQRKNQTETDDDQASFEP